MNVLGFALTELSLTVGGFSQRFGPVNQLFIIASTRFVTGLAKS